MDYFGCINVTTADFLARWSWNTTHMPKTHQHNRFCRFYIRFYFYCIYSCAVCYCMGLVAWFKYY